MESRPEEAEPETMVADGAYSGEGNQGLARKKKVKLITTGLTGAGPEGIFAGFERSEDGQNVLKCPAGYVPDKVVDSDK